MSHRLILFDNDGTLNTQFSCWRYIQQPLGIFELQGRKLLEDNLAGKTDYEEFSGRTIATWKGLKITSLTDIINGIPLRDGAIKVLRYFHNHDYRVCAVSSGFDLWRNIFEDKYDFCFDDFLANHIIVDEHGVLTGEIEMRVMDDTPGKNKGEQLRRLAKKYNVSLDETVMVGDGLGDINAFRVADLSFAVCPTHDKVRNEATHVLDCESLESILEFFTDGAYSGQLILREGKKS